MATTTLVTRTNVTNGETDAPQYARVVNIIRNMGDCRCSKDSKVVVPIRTISNPSPLKQSASNRHPGQSHTRNEVDEAITHELAKARYLMHDLADHVLGHIVSTALARDILRRLVEDRVVQVFDATGPGLRDNNHLNVPLDPESNEVQVAIRQAFEDADRHDCIKPDINSQCSEECSSTVTREKGKQRAAAYSFRWITFPAEPLREDDMVSFLNNITDRAFAFARLRLPITEPKLHHRFVAPEDKYHAVPLSYEPDGEDMRPDFLLLPIEAFDESDGFKTVNPQYINFTASRLVGESKNKDLAAGVEQMQRYARGLKRAQPWVYYVLGMAITRDKAVFMRGEGSGTERLELILADGRGCIEFIRILLGLALADKVDLGQNPDVVLGNKVQTCTANNVSHRSAASKASRAATSKATSRRTKEARLHSLPNPFSQVAISNAMFHVRRASDAPFQRPAISSSTSSKRVHSEIAGDDDDDGTRSKKPKVGEDAGKEVDHLVFFPIALYDYECVGVLFTASSIRGRGTTVFCVTDLKKQRLALKMAWQDLGRVAEQDAVMEHLMNKGLHPNLIVPFRMFKVERDGKVCTTLGAIRGFSDERIGDLGIENRVLTVSVSLLKRPVMYFWGVHDFVRGLRGALLGHEYLTTIGILHRDISENNIVLGLRPGDERGYLIDLDMAIPQKAEEPTPSGAVRSKVRRFRQRTTHESPDPHAPDDEKPRVAKGLRTGTFPYISYNVLRGGRHTHFDDVESFLYVLLLFFFSYAGPLSDTELREADQAGFVQSIGSGRPTHMRNWPKEYADWADGNPRYVADRKFAAIVSSDGAMTITQGPEFTRCLEHHWPRDLRQPISDLVEGCFEMFSESTLHTRARGFRTEVSHGEFISRLDEWLDAYSDLEDEFSNCPFKLDTKIDSSE